VTNAEQRLIVLNQVASHANGSFLDASVEIHLASNGLMHAAGAHEFLSMAVSFYSLPLNQMLSS
jgi:hypothetical protein